MTESRKDKKTKNNQIRKVWRGVINSCKSKKEQAIQFPKEQTMIHETTHRKLKIQQHKHHKKRTWTQMIGNGKQFLIHKLHPSCYSC